MLTTNEPTPWPARLEGGFLVLIVIFVGLAAGAASFTHVHDWTMANSPDGTSDWFGWANAVISELVPVACLLVIRRRKRHGSSIGYPVVLLIAFAGFSLAAQLGVAVGKVGPSGWLLSAVPALAFMALVKLVLAPVKTDTDTSDTEDTTQANEPTDTPATTPVVDTPPAPAPAVIAAPALTPIPAARPEVPAHLVPTARFATRQHEQTHGRPITADELAALLTVTPTTARELLHTINGHTPTAVNGTPVAGGAR
ncbi:hypothetical protein QTQ03_12510 [Micromonospora sp. WMMA1363]|uniref:hypothetical protein n=1 Tax=Micromonospora sp. WMMA1363 TaxID=3053985 RepID=UPI00259CF35D|nr:hypothetical protein [Micromonospora sp. WMMA1363]MDM4720355.1 hypothetical protein [Micromonospora sp. WMMA1363]